MLLNELVVIDTLKWFQSKYIFCFLGSHFYVSAEGEYEVIKGGKILGRFESGKAFGELAVLYNCKRTASIKCKYFILSFDFIF
jgi:hypothetical protein